MKKNELVKSISTTLTLTLLWLFMTSTAPWIFFRWPGHPYKILTFFCLLVFTAMLLFKIKEIQFSKSLVNLIVVQLAFYLFMLIYQKDLANINLILQLISLMITILYIRHYLSFEIFVKSYVNIILITGIGGAIAFFIHLFVGITPVFRVNYGNEVSFFLGLTTTNIFIDTGDLRILRFSGFFDEPGNFGLYSLFAIILNKIYFENRRSELLLIIVTCFTLSVAFYFSIFIYLILFYFNKKNWHLFFLFVFSVLAFYLLLQYLDNPIVEMLNKLTFSRVQETSEDFSGSNRGDLISNDYSVFSDNFLLGAGYSNPKILGSNFFSIFARYGILGAFFYYFMLVYLLFVILKKKSLYYMKFFIVLLIVLVHRPEIANIFTLLLLFTLIYFIEGTIRLNIPNQIIKNDIS